MNKTLLLILCDFLLLTLLALVDWQHIDDRESIRPSGDQAASARPNATGADKDLVAAMQSAFEDEQARRDALTRQLQATSQTLSQREQLLAERENTLSQREQAITQLDSTLRQTRQSAEQLRAELSRSQQNASSTLEQSKALARQLAAQEAEAKRQAEALAAAKAERETAQKEIENLRVDMRVAAQENALLKETSASLRQQVNAEREERRKAQETATQLAQGVGQLADQSASLTKEIREHRPINANTIFETYLANRLQINFTARRDSFLGEIKRERSASTVLVSDGKLTYAILHIEDTPFSLGEPGADWAGFSIQLAAKNGRQMSMPQLDFLKADPRAVGLPLSPEQVSALGVTPYQTALDPYRFPEAVLIAKDGRAYGEVPFKLDPTNPGYVRMDTRLVRKLFADYNPSRGDLVFSKTGELLGLMVNRNYCVVIGAFAASASLPARTDLSPTPTAPILDAQSARQSALPSALKIP